MATSPRLIAAATVRRCCTHVRDPRRARGKYRGSGDSGTGKAQNAVGGLCPRTAQSPITRCSEMRSAHVNVRALSLLVAVVPHSPPPSSFDWAGLRDWLIAVGTLAAVIVSLYVAVWRERVRRPSLSLLFSDPPQSIDKQLTESDDEKSKAASVRLRVKNKPARRTAREVEVLIQKIWAEDREAIRIEDWPLRWKFSDPTNKTPATLATVPPGVSRPVLLFWVEESTSGLMFLGNWPDAGGGRDILEADTWHIRLALAAHDTPSTFWEMTVTYDGIFDDDVLDRIKVSRPRKRPSGKRRFWAPASWG